MKSAEGWKWYGFAGHHVCGARMQYHLCTNIGGKYLISTIGKFVPDPLREPYVEDTVGCDRLYETMVFEINGDDKNGDPNIVSWDGIDSAPYNKSLKAEKGHYKLCWKYHKKLKQCA